MKCCDKERDTLYCPDCGTAMGSTKLWGLLKHCEDTIVRKKALLALRRTENNAAQSQKLTQGIKRHEATVAKWSAWAEELRIVILASTSNEGNA